MTKNFWRALRLKELAFGALLAATASGAALADGAPPQAAQTQASQKTPDFPSASASDPLANGLMIGFPPPPDKLVSAADGSMLKFPKSRWAFSHQRELLPTKDVARGEGPVFVFPRKEQDLGALEYLSSDGVKMTIADMLEKNYADGFLVLHEGAIVYERYFGALTPGRPHIAMSVTKSFVGLMAAMLAHEGKLDRDAMVARTIPELAQSGFGDATVRQVLDMTTGVEFSENYADPRADIWRYVTAAGAAPPPPNYQGAKTLYAFLSQIKKQSDHGLAFDYKTANAEVAAWIVARASGQSIADFLSTRIWSKLGAENSAYFIVDSAGSEMGGGGLNLSLRDLGRFGEMMRNNGAFNGAQIVAPEVIAEIVKGAPPEKFSPNGPKGLSGGSYHDFWWLTHNANGAYLARGIFGQSLYIDPVAKVTIARLASHPIASNLYTDPISLPAYRAIAHYLDRR